MAKQLVFCEIDTDTQLPIRILKTTKAAIDLPPERVVQMARKVAVEYIRLQVVARAIRDKLIRCEFCGKILTSDQGHMHEVVSRGNGGEISLENSRFICAQCHIGPDGEHGNRKWDNASRNN